jgi:hypothetical protein
VRFVVLALTLAAGVGAGAALLPAAHPWTSAHFHHDRGAGDH